MSDRIEQGDDDLPIYQFDLPSFEDGAARLRRQLQYELSLSLQITRPANMVIITDVS